MKYKYKCKYMNYNIPFKKHITLYNLKKEICSAMLFHINLTLPWPDIPNLKEQVEENLNLIRNKNEKI